METKSRQLLLWGILGFSLLVLFVTFLPWFVTHWSIGSLGVSEPNEIGDTIGGIMGPTVGLIGAALTFFAFWAQYDANIEQRRQFNHTIENQKLADKEQKAQYELEQKELNDKYEREQEKQRKAFEEQQSQFMITQLQQQEQIMLQDKRTRLDLFESKFYTMLSIHRDNVNSMDINKIEGRKVFLHMVDELRFIYWIVKNFYDKSPQIASPGNSLNEKEIYQVAYLSFFFGVGEKSTPLITDLGGPRLVGFIENVHAHISHLIAHHDASETDYAVETPSSHLTWKRVHTLGVGHLRRLSHYIRHLFQTVKFVDDQPNELMTNNQKYDYVTNLRAQLSTHEQLLLYYNSLSVLGEPWLTIIEGDTENYVSKYCMIKSIPINSADFYINPVDILPTTNKLGKPMFEWTEIRKRIQELAT